MMLSRKRVPLLPNLENITLPRAIDLPYAATGGVQISRPNEFQKTTDNVLLKRDRKTVAFLAPFVFHIRENFSRISLIESGKCAKTRLPECLLNSLFRHSI